jgi:hypothetical protein
MMNSFFPGPGTVHSTGGGSPTQVRVTFTAPSGAGLALDHASIGIQAAAGDPVDTTATPVQLFFSSSAGFSISSGTSITSDWATLAVSSTTGTVYSRTLTTDEGGWGSQWGFRGIHGPITGSSTPVVITQELNGATVGYVSGAGSDSHYYYQTGDTYNVADVDTSGMGVQSGRCYNVTLIETQ